MAVDLSVFQRLKTKQDFDRESEEFNIKRQLANAELKKANQLDVDKLGEVAFMKAAMGQELTPQERAAAQYVDAKSGGIQFDPVNGGMIQKPRISDKIGIPGLQPSQTSPQSSPQGSIGIPLGGMSPVQTGPEWSRPVYGDDLETNFISEMKSAQGNPKLQQTIQENYRKGRIDASAEEQKAAGFSERMKESAPTIDKYQQIGTSLKEKALGSVPLVGNYLVSDEYQMLDQAKRDFINAQLRRESGAVISPQEFDNANKQYFPQPGDSDAVLKQKAVNRQTALQSMQKSAGPSYSRPAQEDYLSGVTPLTMQDLGDDLPVVDPMAASRNAIMQRNAEGIQNPNQTLPQPAGQPAAPQRGQVVNGYMFNGGDPSKQSSWKKVK